MALYFLDYKAFLLQWVYWSFFFIPTPWRNHFSYHPVSKKNLIHVSESWPIYFTPNSSFFSFFLFIHFWIILSTCNSLQLQETRAIKTQNNFAICLSISKKHYFFISRLFYIAWPLVLCWPNNSPNTCTKKQDSAQTWCLSGKRDIGDCRTYLLVFLYPFCSFYHHSHHYSN